MLSYIIIGSNQGEREEILNSAKVELTNFVGNIVAESAIYETEAWGFSSQSKFLNQVIAFETSLNPHDLLKIILQIEKKLGRKRECTQYADRVIDIDILFYDHLIIKEQHLTIPHPRLAERKFVLIPMAEIASDFIHPVSKKTMKELLAICEDKLKVTILN